MEVLETLSKIAPVLAVDPLIDIMEGSLADDPDPWAADILVEMNLEPDRLLEHLRRAVRNAETNCVADFFPALLRMDSRARAAVPDLIEAVREERLHYPDGAVMLGLLLEGTGKPPLILDRMLDLMDPEYEQEEIALIRKARAAIKGDRAASDALRAWASTSW
jgi:hypothetical protein